MREGGRVSAAIEVVEALERQKRPVREILKDWGHSHRFAGAGDRSAIADLVFDVLRNRLALAAGTQQDTPRLLCLAALRHVRQMPINEISEILTRDPHAPLALTQNDVQALDAALPPDSPEWVQANIPEFVWEDMQRTLGDDARAHGQALSKRAPVDLRINTLKLTPERALSKIAAMGFAPTTLSPIGLRREPSLDNRHGRNHGRNIENTPEHKKGWFEVQDEGSQLAALLMAAAEGEQILDYCAGAGGKTLALAAEMNNRGQIYAHDESASRLSPLVERSRRAGVRNLQITAADRGEGKHLAGRMDGVLLDVPCSGSGAWRRRPDAKWRLTRAALDNYVQLQAKIFDEAADFVRPGGRLHYVTCSLFAQENSEQISAFLQRRPEFKPQSLEGCFEQRFGEIRKRADIDCHGHLTLSPLVSNTDGFFIASLIKTM